MDPAVRFRGVEPQPTDILPVPRQREVMEKIIVGKALKFQVSPPLARVCLVWCPESARRTVQDTLDAHHSAQRSVLYVC